MINPDVKVDTSFLRLESRSRLMTLEGNTWRYIKGRVIVTQPWETGRFRTNEVRPALIKQGPTKLTKYIPKNNINKKGHRGEKHQARPIHPAESIRDPSRCRQMAVSRQIVQAGIACGVSRPLESER